MIKMIFAVGEDGEFGLDKGLPWDIKSDMAHFKEYTKGCDLIMSGSTFESLPFKLPGRTNAVISDREVYAINGDKPDITYSKSIDLKSICENLDDKPDVCIIGGRDLLYKGASFVDQVSITHIHKMHYKGATHILDVEGEIYPKLIERGVSLPHIFSKELENGVLVEIADIGLNK